MKADALAIEVKYTVVEGEAYEASLVRLPATAIVG